MSAERLEGGRGGGGGAKEKEEVERDHPQVVWQGSVVTIHKWSLPPVVTTGHKNSDHCNGQLLLMLLPSSVCLYSLRHLPLK